MYCDQRSASFAIAAVGMLAHPGFINALSVLHYNVQSGAAIIRKDATMTSGKRQCHTGVEQCNSQIIFIIALKLELGQAQGDSLLCQFRQGRCKGINVSDSPFAESRAGNTQLSHTQKMFFVGRLATTQGTANPSLKHQTRMRKVLANTTFQIKLTSTANLWMIRALTATRRVSHHPQAPSHQTGEISWTFCLKQLGRFFVEQLMLVLAHLGSPAKDPNEKKRRPKKDLRDGPDDPFSGLELESPHTDASAKRRPSTNTRQTM
jgi:hypothetical protein